MLKKKSDFWEFVWQILYKNVVFFEKKKIIKYKPYAFLSLIIFPLFFQ